MRIVNGVFPADGRLRVDGERRRALGRVGLIVVLAAQLVVVLDFSIVNVALPSLSRGLGVSFTNSQWVVTAYALTFGGFLIVGGRAADLFGRRRLLLLGLVAFAGASVAGGLSPNFAVLVASRALQGSAAALVAPSALSILTTSHQEGPDRNRVLGYYGIMASVGFVVGLAAGGILVDTAGWRAVFFVNVPVCLVMATVGRLVLPRDTNPSTQRRLDLWGASILTVSMVALVLAPTLGATDGWGSVNFISCVLVGAAVLFLYTRHESRAADPLMPLAIFRRRNLVVGDVIAGLLGATNAVEVLILSLYFQQVLGFSALRTGLMAIPQGVGGLLRGVLGPTLLDRIGVKRFLLAAASLTAVSTYFLFRFAPTTRYPLLAVVLIGIGFGGTSLIYGSTVAGTSGVANDQQGLASAIINATRQMGAAIGAAVLLPLVAATSAPPSQLAARYRTALLWAAVVAAAAALVALGAVAQRRSDEVPRTEGAEPILHPGGPSGRPIATGDSDRRRLRVV